MKKYFKTIDDIKTACNQNKKVYWVHDQYIVYKDAIGQYLVTCLNNDSTIGLHDSHNPTRYFMID